MMNSPLVKLFFVIAGLYFMCGQPQTMYGQESSLASISDTGNFGKDNVPSLYSGTLDWRSPLLTVNGRGTTSFSPSLKVNSTPWRVKSEFVFDNYAYEHYYNETLTNEPDPDPGFGPGFLVFKRELIGSVENNSRKTLTRLYFYSPNGGKTEFIDDWFKGSPLVYSHVGYRGNKALAHDGSGTLFISDTQIRDIYSSGGNPNYPIYPSELYPSGYLRFSDGAVYRIDNGIVSWISDVNGNTTSFTYYPGQPNQNGFGTSFPNALIQSVTDSNGRKVEFEYGIEDVAPYGLSDRVIYKGFAGVQRIIRISKRPLADVLSSGETLKNVTELFPDFDGLNEMCHGGYNGQNYACVVRSLQGMEGIYNPTKISHIWYPDGRGNEFKYNSYGELAQVKNSLGSYVNYHHFGVGTDIGLNIRNPWDEQGGSYIHRRQSETLTYKEGGVLERKDTIEIEKVGNDTVTTSRSFDGQTNAKLAVSKHYFYGYFDPGSHIQDPAPVLILYPVNWRDGKEYRTESLDENEIVLKRTESDWQAGVYYPFQSHFGYGLESKARVSETRNIDVPSNQYSKTTLAYDGHNNVVDKYEYDIGIGQPGQLLRRSHIDYVTSSNYVDALNLIRLPALNWISSDAEGNDRASLTTFEYDNYNTDSNHAPLLSRINVVGHDTYGYGVTNVLRGNVTKVTRYADAQTQTGPVSIYSQYDILGNQIKTIDAKGNVSTTEYADSFGYPDGDSRTNIPPGQLNGQSTYAFPSTKAQALGFTAYVQFDYWTGLIVNTEDINGVVSKTLYEDPLDRPTKVVSSVGTLNEIQTNTVYDDTNRRTETKKDLFALNDNKQRSETYIDSLGRVVETRKYEGSDYTVTSKPEYDALGRVKRTTTPFKPSENEQPLWSENLYDPLGRITKVTTPDNAETVTEYFGNSVTMTDPAGSKRRNISDSMGRLIRVDEPSGKGALGSIAAPNQATNYYYDTLGNLVKVVQGGQNRLYLYNSIGQLLRSRVPEKSTNSNLTLSDPLTGNSNWSAGFIYDANGNVLTSTDANNVVTTNTYDSMNRVLTTTYSDGTPTITYVYDDPNISFSKGKLTMVANGISTTEYTSFNSLGNLLTHKQTIDNQEYLTGYSYDLSGNITEQTYPSGRVVKTTIDENGATSAVRSQKTSTSLLITYASDFIYSSSGTVASVRLGNGLFETTKFNDRLQVIELGLGNSTTTTNVWKVNYGYGTTENNGNIKSQSIYDGTITFTQSYEYDPLNRVTEAKEISNSQQTWKQNFGFDRYGNRTSFAQIIGANELPINNQTLPQINGSNNHFSTGQGYEYDLNGNLSRDYEGRQFLFNGENKQTLVKDVNNQVIGEYFYDGTGKRVKKVTASETVIYVYNAVGQLVAEYSNLVNAIPEVTYLTNDILGTPRVKTDLQKQVISRNDYMPFGEDIFRANSGSDNVTQKFTGYERDAETALDFAQARMYQSKLGRFTGVDPVGPNIANPQSLQRYNYCLNNPLRFIDESGTYNRDVHYYLTWALAYAAGFSDIDSALIGHQTQDPDDNDAKSPFSGWKARATYHFTSAWQRIGLWQKFEDNAGSSGHWLRAFELLGDSLHAEEDKYSHAGYGPAFAQSVDGLDDLSFDTAGDYLTQNPWNEKSRFYRAGARADTASLRPELAEAMAQDIFNMLLDAKEVLRRGGHLTDTGEGGFCISPNRCQMHEPLRYGDIKDAILRFITAPQETEEEMKVAFAELMDAIREAQDNRDRDRANSHAGYG